MWKMLLSDCPFRAILFVDLDYGLVFVSSEPAPLYEFIEFVYVPVLDSFWGYEAFFIE